MPFMKTDQGTLVQVRLPEDIIKAVDHLAVDWDVLDYRGWLPLGVAAPAARRMSESAPP